MCNVALFSYAKFQLMTSNFGLYFDAKNFSFDPFGIQIALYRPATEPLLSAYAIWTLKNANFSHYLFIVVVVVVSADVHFISISHEVSIVEMNQFTFFLSSLATKSSTASIDSDIPQLVVREQEIKTKKNKLLPKFLFSFGLFSPHQSLFSHRPNLPFQYFHPFPAADIQIMSNVLFTDEKKNFHLAREKLVVMQLYVFFFIHRSDDAFIQRNHCQTYLVCKTTRSMAKESSASFE